MVWPAPNARNHHLHLITENRGVTRRVFEWLFSLSWQFYNLGKLGNGMPDPATWAGTTAPAALMAAPARGPTPTVGPSAGHRVPVASKPSAVAAQTQPKPTTPRVSTPPPAVDMAADDDLMEDLQALYAIRDASLGQAQTPPAGPSGEKDFESTHPGRDDSVAPQPGRRR